LEKVEEQPLRLGILGGLAFISDVIDAVRFLLERVLLGSSSGVADGFSVFLESFGWTFSSSICAAEAAAAATAEEFRMSTELAAAEEFRMSTELDRVNALRLVTGVCSALGVTAASLVE
jgi:hypothetical protein